MFLEYIFDLHYWGCNRASQWHQDICLSLPHMRVPDELSKLYKSVCVGSDPSFICLSWKGFMNARDVKELCWSKKEKGAWMHLCLMYKVRFWNGTDSLRGILWSCKNIPFEYGEKGKERLVEIFLINNKSISISYPSSQQLHTVHGCLLWHDHAVTRGQPQL